MRSFFAVSTGPLLAYGLAGGVLNPSSVSAAGALVSAGLFAIAVAMFPKAK